MDPSIIVASIGATVAIAGSWWQWRAERAKVKAAEHDGEANRFTESSDRHLARLDNAVEKLTTRVAALEKENAKLRGVLVLAVNYIRQHNLPWPPPDAEKVDYDWGLD